MRDLAKLDRYDFSGKYFERDADDLGRRIGTVLGEGAKGASRLPLMMSIGWGCATFAFSVAPKFSPLVNEHLWLFPAAMSTAAFVKWMSAPAPQNMGMHA
jgi:hypothetical protein